VLKGYVRRSQPRFAGRRALILFVLCAGIACLLETGIPMPSELAFLPLRSAGERPLATQWHCGHGFPQNAHVWRTCCVSMSDGGSLLGSPPSFDAGKSDWKILTSVSDFS
jgi:hypothetical protein